jgi:hypothetical protein
MSAIPLDHLIVWLSGGRIGETRQAWNIDFQAHTLGRTHLDARLALPVPDLSWCRLLSRVSINLDGGALLAEELPCTKRIAIFT